MSAFRRVDAGKAGANALGILVPPGEQTMVIVRPRALEWDLLPARWNGDSNSAPTFCRFNRDEAASVARRLPSILENAAIGGGIPIETFGDISGRRYQAWVRTSEYYWILCSRAPGQAYQPAVFASPADAEQAAQQLASILWPAPGTEQEIYFNTQLFG